MEVLRDYMEEIDEKTRMLIRKDLDLERQVWWRG